MKQRLPIIVGMLLCILTISLQAQTGWQVNKFWGFGASSQNGLSYGWGTGNMGNSWDEGEWVPYLLGRTIVNMAANNFSNIEIAFDFTVSGARFVDLVRGLQVSTSVGTWFVPNGNSTGHGWPGGLNGTPLNTLTTVADLEYAQKYGPEELWSGFSYLNLPDARMNRAANGAVGDSADAVHYFTITHGDLTGAGISGTYTGDLYIYFCLHLSQTFIWQNALQYQFDTSPTDAWGGYQYSAAEYWPNSKNGSGFASQGSATHVWVNVGGNKNVPIPVPPAPQGSLAGNKFLDINADGTINGTYDRKLEQWPIYVSAIVGTIPISKLVYTDANGDWSLSGLPAAEYTIHEGSQGPPFYSFTPGYSYPDTPLKYAFANNLGSAWTPSSWEQTYPATANSGTNPISIGATQPPAAPWYAPFAWLATLSSTTTSVTGINFGNRVASPECEMKMYAYFGTSNQTEITHACRGEQITITWGRSANGTPDVNGNFTFYLKGPNDPNFGTTPVTSPYTFTASDQTDGTYTIKIVDAFGLENTCAVSLTLYPQPACSVTPAPSTSLDVCELTDITITGPALGGTTTPDTYVASWSWAISTTPGLNNATIIGSTTGQSVVVRPGLYANGSQFKIILTTSTSVANGSCTETCEYTYDISPLLTCPADLSLSCTDPFPAANPGAVTVNCNVSAGTITANDVTTSYTAAGCYTVTRTYSATVGGQTVSCDQLITVSDNLAPVWTTLANALDRTVECDDATALSNAQALFPVATDLCDLNVTNLVKTSGNFVAGSTCPQAGTYTNTWTVTDDCGNPSAVYTQVITVVDTHAPVMTAASNLQAECQGLNPDNNTAYQAWLLNHGGATAQDNCGNVYWSDNTGTATWSGGCSQAITVTFTASDDCGNSDSRSATFTIVDTTPPDITTQASAGQAECEGPNPNLNSGYIAWLNNQGGAFAADLCGNNVNWSDNRATAQWSNNTCHNVITIVFTATDDCGNPATTSATYTIDDTTPPDITTNASNGSAACQGTNPSNNTDFQAWLSNHGGATASDLCGNNVNWSSNAASQSWVGTCPTTITITFTATDACGNPASTSATFTIFDVTAPTLLGVPANVTVNCSNVPPPATTVTAYDLCDSSPSLTMTQSSTQGSNPALCSYYTYVITRTWTATDACSNSTSLSQVITVQDITAPQWSTSINIPTGVIIDCDDDPDDFFWDPQLNTDYSDNCDPNPTLIVTDATPALLANGNTQFTRTWQIVDACLNYSITQTQTLTQTRCQYATYTQGFYGNSNGTDCKNNQTTSNLLNSLLASSLTVGLTGHSFTFGAGDGACVLQYLPAGGTGGVLGAYNYYTDYATSSNCNINPPNSPFLLMTSGKFYNILLGQTVTLALNFRYDPNLAGLPLPDQYNPYLWSTASDYVNGICMDGNDVESGTPQGFYIPVNVLIALGSNGTNRTLTDLLGLANSALAGNSISPATIPEVVTALNAFNVGFDGARFFYGYHPAMPPKAVRDQVPESFVLHQNHPNPFNPSTTITYTLPVDCTVRLAVYNSLGNEIAVLVNHSVPAGTHSVVWHSELAGSDIGSGVYTYRILAVGSNGEEFHDVKKMMLVK